MHAHDRFLPEWFNRKAGAAAMPNVPGEDFH